MIRQVKDGIFSTESGLVYWCSPAKRGITLACHCFLQWQCRFFLSDPGESRGWNWTSFWLKCRAYQQVAFNVMSECCNVVNEINGPKSILYSWQKGFKAKPEQCRRPIIPLTSRYKNIPEAEASRRGVLWHSGLFRRVHHGKLNSLAPRLRIIS